jgi:hypothetical protein
MRKKEQLQNRFRATEASRDPRISYEALTPEAQALFSNYPNKSTVTKRTGFIGKIDFFPIFLSFCTIFIGDSERSLPASERMPLEPLQYSTLEVQQREKQDLKNLSSALPVIFNAHPNKSIG